MKILVWFRQDFRLKDNPALIAAAEQGEVIPVYIWAPQEEGGWPPGHMSQVWLRKTIEAFPLPIVTRTGPALKVLKELVEETGAEALYFNRRYEPASFMRDGKILKGLGIEVKTFNASLLVEPWEVSTKEGRPYQVFTPFWKTAQKCAPFPVGGTPDVPVAKRLPESEPLDFPDEKLLWEVGEKAAQERFAAYLSEPDQTSMLSPYIHFGEISPRQIWAEAQHLPEFIRQLFWREFAHHLLFYFPQTTDHPLREEFKKFPWKSDKVALKAWKEGKTGYKFVDAAMRQLAQIGWMPNRQRMVVASFLTKDLLIPWQEGARWFWESLVDADLANNTLGWQWTAGCGADAAPYFRIFNPESQGEQFDPDGSYVREFLGDEQIDPIVDHKTAREEALKAYERIKK